MLYREVENKLKEHSSQLEQIAYIPKGLYGDGVNDDSVILQNEINKAKELKYNKIILPKKTYLLNNDILLYSNLELDINYSSILSNRVDINNPIRLKSLFKIWGESEFDFINYLENLNNNIHIDIPNSSQLLTIEKYETELKKCSRIKTSDNSKFKQGDYICVYGWTKDLSINTTYSKDLYEPSLRLFTRITHIDTDYIYLEYYNEFDFPSFIYNNGCKSVAFKVNPIKNVKIKNLPIKDITSSSDINKGVSLISTLFADNIKFENIEVENHRMVGIFPYLSRNINMENVTGIRPQLYEDGGRGYLTQIFGCNKINIKNAKGIECRHIVDFSASSNAIVEDSGGYNEKQGSFDLHGICEFDITFKNCKGYLIGGNGVNYFPNMSKNIKVINSKMNITGLSYLDENFIDEVYINDSKLTCERLPSPLNLTIENSSLNVKCSSILNKINKRNQNIYTKLIFDNVDFIGENIDTQKLIYISGYDEVIFDKSHLKSKDSYFSLRVGGTGVLKLNDNTLENINILYSNSRGEDSYISLRDNIIKNQNALSLLDFQTTIANTNIDFKIKGNTIVNTKENYGLIKLTEFTTLTNSKIFGVITDNIINNTLLNFNTSYSGSSVNIRNYRNTLINISTLNKYTRDNYINDILRSGNYSLSTTVSFGTVYGKNDTTNMSSFALIEIDDSVKNNYAFRYEEPIIVTIPYNNTNGIFYQAYWYSDNGIWKIRLMAISTRNDNVTVNNLNVRVTVLNY